MVLNPPVAEILVGFVESLLYECLAYRRGKLNTYQIMDGFEAPAYA